MSKKVHFIAIGGAAMHNMAIALKKKGYTITGSDDEIFEPSKGRLNKYGLLPKKVGWDVGLIHKNLDAIILGMHARKDNPELIRAKHLKLPIYSFPEYVYEQTKDKQRIVIGGSHGKTTLTSMILHVLNHQNINTDFLVGAQLEGFDCMVKLSEDSKIAILEGDEYLSSPLDLRPKFHLYKPTTGLITGIAWDHINVFPTFKDYLKQFEIFIDLLNPDGTLLYFKEDKELVKLVKNSNTNAIGYGTPSYKIVDGKSVLFTKEGEVELGIFGKHNLQNLEGARLVCEQLGVDGFSFFNSIKSFTGASNRLEKIAETELRTVYKDFAHSPSKVKATVYAAKEQFPNRELIACLELHTFSSLNAEFLDTYKNTLDVADIAYVYYNPSTVEHKKLKPISEQIVLNSFSRKDLHVLTNSNLLTEELFSKRKDNQTFLLMSSGNFDGLDLKSIGEKLVK